MKIVKFNNISFRVNPFQKGITIEKTFLEGKFKKASFEEALKKLIRGKGAEYYLNTGLKEYKSIIPVLRKNSFRLAFKKVVYSKKITKIDEPRDINFISLKVIGKKLFFKEYKNAIKNTEDSDFEEDKNNIIKSFKKILSSNSNWNFLALKDKKVIGILILEKFDKYYSTNFIYIKPKFQGKGYSLIFLQKAENEFYKHSKKEWLESTSENNTAMKKSLKKYGFKKSREIYCFKRL